MYSDVLYNNAICYTYIGCTYVDIPIAVEADAIADDGNASAVYRAYSLVTRNIVEVGIEGEVQKRIARAA